MGMTGKKPPNLRYVDMCIYIDDVVKNGDIRTPMPDDVGEKVYKYLYGMYYNSACRGRYFNSINDYDEFARWCATKAFMRLADRRQLTGEFERIKSIKNYWEATTYGGKIKWQNETFQTILSEEYTSGFNYTSYREEIQNNIKNSNRTLLVEEVKDTINNLSEIIDTIVKQTPYTDDKLMIKHLKISVMLSLYREITNISNCRNSGKYFYKYINNLIAWRNAETVNNLISVMVNRVKEKFTGDINSSISKFDLEAIEASDLTITEGIADNVEGVIND